MTNGPHALSHTPNLTEVKSHKDTSSFGGPTDKAAL